MKPAKFISNLILIIMALSSFFSISACHDMKRKADLIVYNAFIYTVDSAFSTTTGAVVIRNGKILECGHDDWILSRYDATVQINAKKHFVYPGFIDAHSHFYGLAQMQRYADLSAAGSFTGVLKQLKLWNQAHPSGWILGRGWDQNKWPGRRFPDNKELDRLFPGIPVVLTRIDGHAVLASTEAIRRSNLGAIPPGEAIYDGNRLTGIFLEGTADKIKAAVPGLSEAETEDMLFSAAGRCYAAGLTSVTDAGLDRKDIIRLDSLQKAGKLSIRVNAMLNPTEENFRTFLDKGIYKTPQLTVRSVKLYADGALGSRGACLKKPYSDDRSNFGVLVISKDVLRETCEKAYHAGYQVCTHAIGDSAVAFILRNYGIFLKGHNDRRWRIEHSQVVDPEDLYMFGKFSIIPSIQTTHATSDMGWAETRLGNRVINAYPYKRLLAQNGWLPDGTDFPIESIEPLKSFYAGVARKDINGAPAEGFQTTDALSRKEALESITIWAAKAAFEEKEKGSIEKGKYGDLVILDQDIMKIPEKDILKTNVLYTIINGKVVFDSSKQK